MPYDKIFKHDGEQVSLSVMPTGENREADAMLLLMLGRKHYKAEIQVTGGRLLQGLAQTGFNLARVDRLFPDESLILRTGQNRGTRYRLTNPGQTRAEALARELAGRVA